jgi:hypothetical protein
LNIDEYLFLKALNCPKYLSLDNSHPELKKTAKGHDNLRDKKKVKELAVKLFPGGVFIDKNLNIEERIRQTKELINAPVIYNAAFSVFDIFFTVDILVNNNGAFEIYKITPSLNPKDNQIKSLSFKYYCLKSLGYNISKASIAHINKNYQAPQDKTTDLNNLFIIKDYTKNASNLLSSCNQAVIDFQNNFSYYDAGIDIGEQCFKNDCDFKDYCFKDIPEQSVFNLYKLSINEKLRLYKEKIVDIENIPEELAAKRKIWKVQKDNKEFIDKKVIKDFLKSLSYPLSFLDFETFCEAVPSYSKQTPYQNIPFQYSLHILEKNGSLTHKEFLCTENTDPRPGLINSLINDLPGEGKIIAFNDKFEKSVIKELSGFQPDKSDKLLSLIPRFIDLITPFKKVGFYLPKMNGSFSLKSVLPAMFPNDLDLDYGNMEIQNGLLAMDGYFRIMELRLNNDSLDAFEEIEKIKNNLLKYCELDTFAMVKILQKLIELYKTGEI